MNMESLHLWLRAALPADSATLLHELEIGRKAQPTAYEGLPSTSLELSEALRALEVRGLVERRNSEWFWKAEAAKPEPQGVLFG